MLLGFLTDGRVEDVAFAARRGFDCLELALFGETPLFRDHGDLERALEDQGVPLVAVSLFGVNYFHRDPAEARKARDLLERVMDLAAALGAPLLVAGTGTPPGDRPQERVLAAVERFCPILRDAQSHGLDFAFYNCSWENVIDRPSAWEVALPKLQGAGVKFDPSHPIQAGRDWKLELLAAGPHLMHCHAKDVLRAGGQFIPDPNPGLGEMRWEEFYGILNHVGYDNAVCIEPHSPLYAGTRRHGYLELSRRYLRQFYLDPTGL